MPVVPAGLARVLTMSRTASKCDMRDVREALDAHGLASSVAHGPTKAFIGVDGVPGVPDTLSAPPVVHEVIRIDSPYPLVSAENGHRSSVRAGNAVLGPATFTFIAGPCAIESPDQAWAAWDAATEAGATMLRGDIYKHRTSPYSFQGLGASGLELLAERRRCSPLPLVAEVLEPQHVAALADVVDVLRVGSRNMQNCALLRACAESGKPVMLKRGLTATIEEWLLAAEYVADAGSLDIILCERGIRTFDASTRNTLDLTAVPFVQQRSHLPVVVDPSHASGLRSLVAPLALAAVAAGADGVMVDVHPHPHNARCDGPQALLPTEVVQLGHALDGLARRMGRTSVRGVDTSADRAGA